MTWRFAGGGDVAQALLPARGAKRRMDQARGERREGEEQAAATSETLFIPHSAEAGYSLVEMLAAVVIFGIFLVILVGLQREFLHYDGEMRVALFTHPAPFSVLARLRRDILDSRGFPASVGEWTQTSETLLLDVIGEDDTAHVVVWDFSKHVIARRIELKDGQQFAEWEARAVPSYQIDNWEAPDGRTGVLVTAKDGAGNVVVDQIVTPRAR